MPLLACSAKLHTEIARLWFRLAKVFRRSADIKTMAGYYTTEDYSQHAREFGEAAAAYIEQEVERAHEEGYYHGANVALNTVWEALKGFPFQTRARRIVGRIRTAFKTEAAWEKIPENRHWHPWSTRV